MYKRTAQTLLPLLLAGSGFGQQRIVAANEVPSVSGHAATAAPAVVPASALTLATRVIVTAKDEKLDTVRMSTVEISGRDVAASAGTFGDLPRYLQTLPGAIGGADSNNASFVRGGNPFENLFVVDTIEVPNINHLALATSTGGLASMIDTESISTATFQRSEFDPAYQSHLSSVTEIHTLELPMRNLLSADVGYAGAGFRMNRALSPGKTLMVSARESLTNLFLHDVGLNGSPEFTNSLVKFTDDIDSHDRLSATSLSGRDVLHERPSATDVWETNPFNTDYSGWRNTTGVVWQHTTASEAVSTWVVSNSQNAQTLQQRSQITNDSEVFHQYTREGQTVARYQYLMSDAKGFSLSGGADVHQIRLNDDTAQAAGSYSAYSASTTPLPASQSVQSASFLDKGVFANVSHGFGTHVMLRAGLRYEGYGSNPSVYNGCGTPSAANAGLCGPSVDGSRNAFLPHASLSVLAGSRVNLRAGYSRTAQMPPYATIAGTPANAQLGVIHGQQSVVGATALLTRALSFNVEAYRKLYSGYPVSTEFPQLSMAAITPSITEPFLVLPMASLGRGITKGVEFTLEQKLRHHVMAQANLTLASALFTGADGVYRPGSNDLPVVFNTLGGFEYKRMLFTARDTYASGRPYTPILASAAYAQNRMIYDLTQINAQRAAAYNRLDVAVNREWMVHGRVMRVHAGLINVLNRQNFYEYLWRSRCGCDPWTETQIGIQPDFSLNYIF